MRKQIHNFNAKHFSGKSRIFSNFPLLLYINSSPTLPSLCKALHNDGYLNTFETIYDPEKDEPQETTAKEQPTSEQQTVTFVQLRSRLSEISRSGHTAEVKELIAKYGADKLSDLAESDYAVLLAEAEGLV